LDNQQGISMKVYVVTCQTEGCEECGSHSHVVGVFKDRAIAEGIERAHSDARPHFHSSFVDTEEFNVE
jgi:hypothetical protein